MNVLVVNAGSSSLKYQLLDTESRDVLARGNCERIGLDEGLFGHAVAGGDKVVDKAAFPDHAAAIERVLDELDALDVTIDGIGHRIVQGGWYFHDSALVDDDVLAKIYEVAPLAPLHNYGEAAAIEYCRKRYPAIPNVAVFDTSFHMTMPAVAVRMLFRATCAKSIMYASTVPTERAIATSGCVLTSCLAIAAISSCRAIWVMVARSPLSRTVSVWIPPWGSLRSMVL